MSLTDFEFRGDFAAERGTVKKHVAFKINTAEISADELEEITYSDIDTYDHFGLKTA